MATYGTSVNSKLNISVTSASSTALYPNTVSVYTVPAGLYFQGTIKMIASATQGTVNSGQAGPFQFDGVTLDPSLTITATGSAGTVTTASVTHEVVTLGPGTVITVAAGVNVNNGGGASGSGTVILIGTLFG
jgi:hypothetical protein